MAEWEVRRIRGEAADVHHRDLEPTVGRSITIVDVSSPAIVLGSTQPESDVDLALATRLGVEVVRRRSGGGAVLLDPRGAWWIDVEIGRDDPLWRDDIGTSSLWLGRAWVDALDAVGVGGAVVHDGPMRSSPLATVVCFAGLAPGEVSIDGEKVVGISQRRTRAGARFQCSVPRRWDAERITGLLRPGLERAGVTDLRSDVAVRSVDDEALADAFLDALR